MKKFLSLVFVAVSVSSCGLLSTAPSSSTYQPSQQHFFLQAKDFSQRSDAMSLNVSSARMDGNFIKLFVHVTDTNHFSYQGIDPGSFCNTSVWRNYDEPTSIRNPRISEVRNITPDPMAIAIVLDYSSSMDKNKTHLYDITQKFIDKKRDSDAYSIFRYGSSVHLEVPLTKDKSVLKNKFAQANNNAVSGSTATWDALTEGIASVEHSNYQERIVVVLTDGAENASKVTQEWAFWRAKQSGVKIVTISLGLSGSENMKALSESTGGMYSFINTINEVDHALTDFMNKQGSYYSIEFQTPIIGKQTVRVNLCNNIALHGDFTFDNRPPGLEPVRLKDLPPNYTPPVESTTPPRQPTTTTGTTRQPVSTTTGGGRGSTGTSTSGGARTPNTSTTNSTGRTSTTPSITKTPTPTTGRGSSTPVSNPGRGPAHP